MKYRLGIVGSGKIATIVANAWKDGMLEDYELVYIAGRDANKAKALADKVGAPDGGDYSGMLEARPDYIVEAASIQFLKENAIDILRRKINLVIISIGVLADSEFNNLAAETARENGVKLVVSNGVVGGFDILRTFRLMGEVDAHFTTHKGPVSLRGTALHSNELESSKEETTVFDGTAAEIIKILPTKVNVAVASSLAAASPEKTKATMISVPDMIGDEHQMVAKVNGSKAIIDVYTTDGSIAAYGLISTLQNLTSPIKFI